MTRAVFSPAVYVSNSDTVLTLSLPNPVHRDKCEQHRDAVEQALAASMGAPVTLELIIAGGGGPGGGGSRGPGNPGESGAPGAAPGGAPAAATGAGAPVGRAPDAAPIDPSHPAAGALADDDAAVDASGGPGHTSQAAQEAPSTGQDVPDPAQPPHESPRRAAERKAAEAAAEGSGPVKDGIDSPVTEAEIAVLPEDHEVDLTELVDAPPETVKTPIDRLAEAFPGSELVTETY